jgi:hypothetical protein
MTPAHGFVIGTHVTWHIPPVTPLHARSLVSGDEHGSAVPVSRCDPVSAATSTTVASVLPAMESPPRPLSIGGSVPLPQPAKSAIAKYAQEIRAMIHRVRARRVFIGGVHPRTSARVITRFVGRSFDQASPGPPCSIARA